jgi:hypothetical protein
MIESRISEYDQRQYQLMLEAVSAFQNGQLKIDALISNLDGLFRALEGHDEAWRKSFFEYWADLEQARAIALFRGRSALDEQETKVVFEAVDRLKLLVLEKIDDPADHSQEMDWSERPR